MDMGFAGPYLYLPSYNIYSYGIIDILRALFYTI